MFKMNKKGFTLIELIAVIILLSLILVIAVPNLIDTYRQSKLKSEEMFLKQLTKSIESYVSLEASSFTYGESFPANKTLTKKIYNRDTQKYEEQETTLPVTVYKSSNKSIKDVIECTNQHGNNAGNREFEHQFGDRFAAKRIGSDSCRHKKTPFGW